MARLLLHGPDLQRDLHQQHFRRTNVNPAVHCRPQGQDGAHGGGLQKVNKTVKHREERDDK
jgi:hypothetical protein